MTLPDKAGTVNVGEGIDDNATSTAVTIDSSGNVRTTERLRIGTSSSDTRITLNNEGTEQTNSSNYIRGVNGTLLYNSAYSVHKWEIAGSEKMRIDASGRVTTPYQPAFHVRLTATTIYSANSIFGPGTVKLNIGSHFSTPTGLFTAPVSGVYMFYASFLVQGDNTTSTYLSAQLSINGSADSTYGAIYANNFQIENNISGTFQISLSANDTVGIALLANGNVSLYATESFMGGRLLG
jgi:hypothetical protein